MPEGRIPEFNSPLPDADEVIAHKIAEGKIPEGKIPEMKVQRITFDANSEEYKLIV